MSKDDQTGPIREVIGIFFDAGHLKEAIADLESSGFESDQIGLLASEHAIERALGDLYVRTRERHDPDKAPATAFVKNSSVGDTFRALEGGLIFVGSTAAMGALVASAAVFGGALLTAAAGVAAVGAAGALLGGLIHQSDAEYLEQQIEEGHLLLFVRTRDAEDEERAVRILSTHSGFDVRVHKVPDQPRKPIIHR